MNCYFCLTPLHIYRPTFFSLLYVCGLFICYLATSGEYLHIELINHREKLLKLTKLTKKELLELEGFITHHITFIDERLLPQKLIESTQKQLADIDPFDVPFVALAKHLDAKLWTGDLKLTKGLKEKHFKNIISTTEMATLFNELEM